MSADDQPKPAPGEEEDEVRLRPAGDARVKHRKDAAPAPKDKTIHPRRPLSAVPEKPEDPDE